MAWLRITIHHGPGHQSETVKYRFFRRITKAEVEDVMSEEANEVEGDWPIVKMNRVTALPASKHKELTQHYHYQRDDAVAMLEILGKTKTTREYEWRCAKCGDRWTRHSKKCPNAVCGGRVRRVVVKQEE
jgi:rRNA maturation endonuclease Nob1